MSSSGKSRLQLDAKLLLKWFSENQRPLPWRLNRDPYRIWIAEVMLQQTTTRAVIPFYERFMERFPTLAHLAKSSEEKLYPYWAGLGYYSRARNLLKAAKEMNVTGVPQTAEELLKLPGFGPYTARAVSSQAFGEGVGVVDGNVIRVLCRYYGWPLEWWTTEAKKKLQKQADLLVQGLAAGDVNQALMELGATVCTPKSPTCFLCPWQKNCQSLKQDKISEIPLKKSRREFEVWLWQPLILQKEDKIALLENDYAPFMKGHWFLPGQSEKLSTPPKDFDFRHSITHHKIYVRIESKSAKHFSKKYRWIDIKNVNTVNPASLLKKAMSHGGLL